MQSFLKSAFYLLASPLFWLSDVVSQRKAVSIIRIEFGWNRATVDFQTKFHDQEKGLLVKSYLLFLAKYFCICDDRQLAPVSDEILKYAERSAGLHDLAPALLRITRSTFSDEENDAYKNTFRYPKHPPTVIDYDHSRIDRDERIGKYTFSLLKENGAWKENLRISMGLDIVLLPIAVGLLYRFVAEKIGFEHREALDLAISQLHSALAATDPRSQLLSSQAVNKVIAETAGL